MSLVPNAFGNALGTSAPFLNFAAIGTPRGTWIQPGARVAAYVRSTGAQDLDDLFIRDNLVTSINEAAKRCRSGAGDVIAVLDNHSETHSSSGVIWGNLVAGTKIVGCGRPGSATNGRVTLAHTGASIAPAVAGVEVIGLDIRSTTAALTGAIAPGTAASGFGLYGNYISLTGALGANPAIAVLGTPRFTMIGNEVVVDSTDPIVEITLDTTLNFNILGNNFRQVQATSGGVIVDIASTTGISGTMAYNLGKSATNGTILSLGFVVGANAAATVGSFQNFMMDGGSGGSGLLSPAVGS